jgi:hypothetical protein
MSTYYDVTLSGNIQQGFDILEAPCTVVFTYPGGSRSQDYSAAVFAWPTSNLVRIVSSYLNIEAAWAEANGGTLTIKNQGFAIQNFNKF